MFKNLNCGHLFIFGNTYMNFELKTKILPSTQTNPDNGVSHYI